jgi:hypothetical protein
VKTARAGAFSPAAERYHIDLVDGQAIFFRRRHQPRRPPLAKARRVKASSESVGRRKSPSINH